MAIAFIASCDGFACSDFLVSAAALSRRSWAGRAVMGGSRGGWDTGVARARRISRELSIWSSSSVLSCAVPSDRPAEAWTTAVSPKPAIRAALERGAAPPAESRAGTRRVYWAELGDFEPTPVFWGERLEPGNRIAGPAIVQVPDTTIVVHPGQAARLDPYGNVLIELHGEA